MFQTLLIKIFV